MSGSHLEERCYIFQREQGEKVGMARDQILIALLERFGVKVDIAVVDRVEHRRRPLGNAASELFIRLQTQADQFGRRAINLAR